MWLPISWVEMAMRMKGYGAKFLPCLFGAWITFGVAFADPLEDAEEALRREDYPTALRLVTPLAEGGDAAAQTLFGSMYRDGSGVRQNLTEAVRWFREAAEQGDRDAQTELGSAYREGAGVRRDYAEAIRWYKKAAGIGGYSAKRYLAGMYAEGVGVPKDLVAALRWLRKDCYVPINPTQNTRARRDQIPILGEGLPPAPGPERVAPAPAPVGWSEDCRQWETNAQYALGKIYRSGIWGVEKNQQKAAGWFKQAAKRGHAIAQAELGSMHALGEGVKQSDSEAFSWFRKAAEQGHRDAQVALAEMYLEGEGVRKNPVEAMKWYRKAAEQGDVEAQFNLGVMYDNGEGVQEDNVEAAKWFHKAAEQGYPNAQYTLGSYYYNKGRGVNGDLSAAVTWWRLALVNPQADDAIRHLATDALTRLAPPTPERPRPGEPVLVDRIPPDLNVHNGPKQFTDAADWVLKGKASDPSGVAEVMVDGRAVTLSANGDFTVKRYIPVGETVLEIVATDIHGNRSMQRVTVVRQAVSQSVASAEPALVPPMAKVRTSPHAVALIVGVEDYRNAPRAKWAAQDASLFYDFAQRTLGIPPGNIKLLIGDQANRAGLLAALKTWLAPMVTPGKSHVYVYFAGHGLAASTGDKAYFIPQDGDPSLLEDTALDRQRLFDEIAKAKPLSTTLFLDTCYSGAGRGGEATLVANARPILIKSKAANLPPGFMQFSAASNDQLAHSHPSQQHGLFSYYLMRGLGGEADANRDNVLTAGELQDYVQSMVKRLSLTQGRLQEPELLGDRERVIAAWGK